MTDGYTKTNNNSNNILYIASFLGSTILMNMVAGTKATYYYLLLVLIGVAIVNTGKYNISVTTPEIMQKEGWSIWI